ACFAAAPPPKVPDAWLKLIDQLGEEDEGKRAEAEKELTALGEDVLPALGSATRNHADVDVRLRAAVLTKAIQKKVYGVVRRLDGHKAPVINFALSPDGKRLASTSNGEKDKGAFVRVWDVEKGKQLFALKWHEKGVYAVAWSKDGKRILTASADKTLRLSD